MKPKPSIRFRAGMLLWRTKYQLGRPFRAIARVLVRLFTVYRVAFILALAAILIWYSARIPVSDILPNIVTDLLAVALTVFIIDTMYRVRSDAELKKVLIAQLGSKNNAVTSQALEELSARGWLGDGTLRRTFLISACLDGNSFTGADLRRTCFSFASLRDTTWFEADLEGAFLDHTDLTNASFSIHAVGPHYAEANLKGATLSQSDLRQARVRDEQLVQLHSLWQATMPPGSRYDGRFNLPGDISLHLKSAQNASDPVEWARFYGVTPAEYIAGQLWASQHPGLLQPRERT